MNDELVILFEDNHVIVVVKPQNIPSQGDSSGDKDMLTSIKEYVKEKYNKPGDAFIGLVHRLDRPTGGVMVFAKTSKAASRLAEQMQAGDFEKRYLACVCKKPKNPRGRLVNYLLKDEENNTVKTVPLSTEGAKRAELDYVTLESDDNLSLVEIKLITGRGHQARVQMASIGCPIYGDVKYGATLHRGGKLALWAYSLRFLHPVSNQAMVFKVFPPQENPWAAFPVAKHINVSKPE